jgi:hypothetical protein
MSDPTTPPAWGSQLSKLWMASGQDFPVDVKVLALEVSKTRFPDDPVGLIKAHGISGIDGMLSRRKKKGDWCISYDETVTVLGRINFTLGTNWGTTFCTGNYARNFYAGKAICWIMRVRYRKNSNRKPIRSLLIC